jgi:branched-chain amino acid transport system substrate-binding protein
MPPIPAVALLAAVWLAALAGCAEREPLTLGFVGGLSGRVADLGIAGRNGALLAVEQRSAAGGVNGRSVRLVVRDDAQEPATAREAVAQLLEQPVAAIVGPMTSAMAVATMELTNRAGVVMISPTVTSHQVSGKDDHFFRVLSSTRDYATKAATYQRKALGRSRIAAAYDLRNRAYTEDWLNDFRAAFEALGGQVVNAVPFESSADVHFQALSQELMEARPDALLIVANSLDTALLARQVRKAHSGLGIVAAEWAATERLIELGGEAVEGIIIAQFLDRTSMEPAYVAFREAYLRRFAQEPGFAGLAAFDATNIVLDALAKTGPSRDLKGTLLATAKFDGAQSPIVFDANGDAQRQTFITTVRQGNFVVMDAE